jgi:uncharacterized protein
MMVSIRYLPPLSIDNPNADEWTQPFWDAAQQERLIAPRCTACGTFRLPPRRFCARCRHQAIEWLELPGTGTLYTFTIIRHPLRPEMRDFVPYIPAVVAPDGAEGARFISNVVDTEPQDVVVGMALRVIWHGVNDRLVLPLWTKA